MILVRKLELVESFLWIKKEYFSGSLKNYFLIFLGKPVAVEDLLLSIVEKL